jgi:Flp pilus assembly protein TadB
MQPIDVGGWRPEGTARDAIRMLLRTLQFFADAAIVFVLFILPTLLVIAIPIAILVLVIRAIWRRVKRRKQEKAAEQE